LARADRRRVLAFAPLQGATRRELERRRRGSFPEETIVLVQDWRGERERVLVRSDAVCAIAAALGRGWRLLALLRFVPRPLRDAGYRFVARRRARWFGRLDACRLPAAHERERFLD
jgi:predicted DCC family thiol-disulfide oxidoreductase YuxK